MRGLFKIFTVFLLFSLISGCSGKLGDNKPDPLEITHKIMLETSEGNIQLALFGNAMPRTVANFVEYVKSGFYDGLIFHRVVKNFVIQGGGFNEAMVQKETRPPIQFEITPVREVTDESGKVRKEALMTHDKYALAMARTRDPHSATSQFYITLAQTKRLDTVPFNNEPNGYAVFGKVIEGFEVVDRIGAKSVTEKNGFRDVPVETVKILKVSVISEPAPAVKEAK